MNGLAGIRRGIAFAPLLFIAALAPSLASADDDVGLSVGPVEPVAGAICVSYRVERPFTPRLEETLWKGMPATVTFEVGLWKRRALWFDKLVLAMQSRHRVIYDEWEKSFRILSGPEPSRTRMAPSMDSLRTALFTVAQLPIAAASSLDSSATYYVSVRVTLHPVTAEDLEEIENWLAGGEGGSRGEARGIPRYLLGLAAAFSGLGDRTAHKKSERFVPARLGARADRG